MPGIIPQYAPNDKKLDEVADKERQARIALIDTYWKYYHDGGVRQPLKIRPNQPNDNVMLNFSKQGIDRLVSFFAPKPPRFNLPEGTKQAKGESGKLETSVSPDQQALNDFLEKNEFDHLITDVGLSGFVSGHSFMRLYPPDNTEMISAENPPRMALLDPRLVTVFWDISDVQRPLWYRLTWQVGQDKYRRQDIVPVWLEKGLKSGNQTTQLDNSDGTFTEGKVVGWWIIEYENKKQSNEYEEVSRDSWPYPFAPIKDWKNKHKPHEYYGESDLDCADLNDSINFIASNTARIIKFHAHPKTVVAGTDVNITETTVDGLWTVPADAKVNNLEMSSDLSSSMNYLDMLRNAYMSQMHVVDLSGIKDKLGQITSFAVRMLYKDMLDATNAKRSLYGSGLSDVVYRAALMMGITLDKKPKDEWDDPLPEDRSAEVASLKVEKDMGIVSKQTIQEELGRDPAVENERMQDDKKESADAMADVLARTQERGAGMPMNNRFGGNNQRMPMAG